MPLPAEVQQLIDNSGHTFHSKVFRWFKEHGWTTTISPYYMDQTQQKAREVDLIAEQAIEIRHQLSSEVIGWVVLRLFVECKYLPRHSVFWFTEKNMEEITKVICADGHFKDHNTYTDKHHYLAQGTRAAKLFVTAKAENQESDPFYKALNQSLNALVSMRDRPPRVLDHVKHLTNAKRIVLDFPVVVCNSFSQMYAADLHGITATEPVTDNFLLEVLYAYATQSVYSAEQLFMLDIVEFDKLDAFTKALEEDGKVAAFFAG